MESDTTPQVRPIPIPTSRRPQVLATDLPIMPAPINTDLLRLSRERHFNIDDFNQVFAATTTSVSAVMIPAYQIRLLPLKTSISLRFDPITRVCREGAPAIKICRFIDPTGIGLASSNDSLTGKISFNSKVISRQHAELWCEANGTFYIKDTSSSSGTFLNQIRLSNAGVESRPYLLKEGDILQLGVPYQGGIEEMYRCVQIRVEIDPTLAIPDPFQDVTSTITPLVNSAAVVEGDTSFPYTQDADANAPASAQAAQGEAGPAQDSEEAASHSSLDSLNKSDEFLDLEKLMQERLPLDLTGEIVIMDFQRFKYGGFAFVYKGAWKVRYVAVKVLKATKNSKRPAPWEVSMQRRLNREINVWAALLHPNIAEFLGFAGGFGDFPAMISTWYNLGTARDYLDDNEDMAVEARIRLVQDVADGLEYLHRLKIIHGDLKPTNVLIDDNHVARLCDFGLVRLDDWQGPAGMTTTSPYTGTERYKAPELFISIDNRPPFATCDGDIWALGCITLEFIKSKIPYERHYHSTLLAKAISDGGSPASRPKISEPNDHFSQYLWDLLEACWAWDPENRIKVNQVVEGLAQLSGLLGETVNA